ncbi:MAG: GtrA family protein [Hafnia sp.]|uniref:GtrA family protein n=1 Tax=Hafnia sp. TaxID=1873498 RepID=UPI002FC74C17
MGSNTNRKLDGAWRQIMDNTLIKFLLTGGLATLLQYFILWCGVEFLGLLAATASGIGYMAGSIVSYFVNYYYTFNSTQSHTGAAARFYIMVGIGWLMNTVIVGLLADFMNWNKWIAQGIATAIVLIWNFCSSRYWVFKSV